MMINDNYYKILDEIINLNYVKRIYRSKRDHCETDRRNYNGFNIYETNYHINVIYTNSDSSENVILNFGNQQQLRDSIFDEIYDKLCKNKKLYEGYRI